MRLLLASAFLCLFVSCSSSTVPSATPESQAISSAAVSKFIDAVETDVDAIHGIVILRNGKMITKGWWAPYRENKTHILYSLSKSFTSTAVGMAVDEGLLRLDDKVVKFFPNDLPPVTSENLKAMTVRDLLTMGTGNHSDTLGPIKKSNAKNWPKVFLAQPVEHRPGTYFRYNTGATYMLSNIVQKVSGQTLIEFLKPRLFEPLGIENYTWETDPMGVNTGGYGLKITTKSIARFGQLYLQGGIWKGKRLISEKWINMATSKQIRNGNNSQSDWNQGYGFQFWMCRHNAYRGDGAFGQYCIVMPEQSTVIAINGGHKNMQQVLNHVWEILLPAMKDKPLAENIQLNSELQSKLQSLILPLVKGNSEAASGIIGSKYKFQENEKDLKSVKIGTDVIEIENIHGIQKIPYSGSEWKDSSISFEKELVRAVGGSNGIQEISSSGAWQSPDHLKIITYMNETPFRLTFEFKFTGKQLNMKLNYNVGFAGRDFTFKATK